MDNRQRHLELNDWADIWNEVDVQRIRLGRTSRWSLRELQYVPCQQIRVASRGTPLTSTKDGAASNLNWTSAEIVKKSGDYTDICFKAPEGEMHWVLTPTLAGAYQYFVNYGLPRLGEFRTLWRLDNSSFTTGHTRERSMALPSLSSIQSGVKIQDETWLLADGSYITKYDFATFLPNIEGAHSVWGISGKLGGTGDEIGSWYSMAVHSLEITIRCLS